MHWRFPDFKVSLLHYICIQIIFINIFIITWTFKESQPFGFKNY